MYDDMFELGLLAGAVTEGNIGDGTSVAVHGCSSGVGWVVYDNDNGCIFQGLVIDILGFEGIA